MLFRSSTVYTDVSFSNDSKTELNAGVQLEVDPRLSVAAGIKDMTQSKQFNTGLSLNLQGVSFHYSFGSVTDLGVVHKTGVSLKL